MPRAIESALAQEGVDLEVIVVDDCSDDGTVEYLQERYGSDIKVASTNVNSGVSTATNIGYQQSTGEHISLLGDDDYWQDPCKLTKQLRVIKDNPRIGVVGTWWVELREGGERVEKTPVPPKSQYFLKERMLAFGGVVCGSTPLICRQAWDAVGGMDEKHVKGTDSDLFRRIILSGYEVSVLHEITTVVDVSHGMPRMTPSKNLDSSRRHLQSHLRVLFTHFSVYFLYPRAMFIRLSLVFRAVVSLLSAKWHKSKYKKSV